MYDVVKGGVPPQRLAILSEAAIKDTSFPFLGHYSASEEEVQLLLFEKDSETSYHA